MIDANMRELAFTGFMSNRGRQIVASYLTRDLGLDWRLGAMYFESVLIDHDPCSNWYVFNSYFFSIHHCYQVCMVESLR